MSELDQLRTILANERTLLAYIRTALAAIVFGMGAIKFFADVHWVVDAGFAAIAAGIFGLLFGLMRFRKVQKSIQ